ncbi:MAG TPA: hypothetical protein VFO27_10495 [Bryobacteraceae bacterium]|nr:hypothetical protein [Bryobacteraceae bacterium]
MAEKIDAGDLEFYPENRMGGQDGGPTLRVCAHVDGSRVELLRLDMFHNIPHYHYAPAGVNLRYDMDPLTLDDGIGWVIGLLRAKLPQMLEKAGHPELATDSNVSQALAVLPEVEQKWRAVAALPIGAA